LRESVCVVGVGERAYVKREREKKKIVVDSLKKGRKSSSLLRICGEGKKTEVERRRREEAQSRAGKGREECR